MEISSCRFKQLSEIFVFFSCLLKERRRWHRVPLESSSGCIGVYYGYESLPTARDYSSGGVVKTQDLQTIFPNTPRNPNILYLISSALPPYAPRMARLAKKAGAMVVLNQNGVVYSSWHGPQWKSINKIMAEVLEQADYVFYQSEFCKLGADLYLQPRNRDCEILYNPVDTNFFQPVATALPLDPLRLLLAGSHIHFYRVRCAVETLACLRHQGVNARLEIAGRYGWQTDMESAKRELSEYISSLSLSEYVVLSGPYRQQEAPAIFQRSHILLHTKYNDPCPRLVVEGLASGLPVVYSTSGGTPELVGRGAGVGMPAPMDWEQDHPPSPEKFAEGVKKIMGSYEQYTLAARKRAVEKFDVKPWLERHKDIFNRFAKRQHND